MTPERNQTQQEYPAGSPAKIQLMKKILTLCLFTAAADAHKAWVLKQHEKARESMKQLEYEKVRQSI